MFEMPPFPDVFRFIESDTDSLKAIDDYLASLQSVNAQINDRINKVKAIKKHLLAAKLLKENMLESSNGQSVDVVMPVQLSIQTGESFPKSDRQITKEMKEQIVAFLQAHGPSSLDEILKAFPTASKASVNMILHKNKPFFRQHQKSKKWALNLPKI